MVTCQADACLTLDRSQFLLVIASGTGLDPLNDKGVIRNSPLHTLPNQSEIVGSNVNSAFTTVAGPFASTSLICKQRLEI